MVNLKSIRLEKGLTQVDIAKYLGISQPAYANYERGLRQADYDTLIKLADLFDVSIDYLLGRKVKTRTLHQRSHVGNTAISCLADIIVRASHARAFDSFRLSKVMKLYCDIADRTDNTAKSVNQKLGELEDLLDLKPFTLHRMIDPPYSVPATIAAESGEKLEGVPAPDEADELSAFEEYENN